MDINDDLTIDLDEALDHLGKAKTGFLGVLHRFVSTPAWFSSIDTNGDGKISTWEFDSDLTDEAMGKFNQMFYLWQLRHMSSTSCEVWSFSTAGNSLRYS